MLILSCHRADVECLAPLKLLPYIPPGYNCSVIFLKLEELPLIILHRKINDKSQGGLPHGESYT